MDFEMSETDFSDDEYNIESDAASEENLINCVSDDGNIIESSTSATSMLS